MESSEPASPEIGTSVRRAMTPHGQNIKKKKYEKGSNGLELEEEKEEEEVEETFMVEETHMLEKEEEEVGEPYMLAFPSTDVTNQTLSVCWRKIQNRFRVRREMLFCLQTFCTNLKLL